MQKKIRKMKVYCMEVFKMMEENIKSEIENEDRSILETIENITVSSED
jgi:hypothetical protein